MVHVRKWGEWWDRRHLRLKSIEGMGQTVTELNCTLLIYTNDTEQGNDGERDVDSYTYME